MTLSAPNVSAAAPVNGSAPGTQGSAGSLVGAVAGLCVASGSASRSGNAHPEPPTTRQAMSAAQRMCMAAA